MNKVTVNNEVKEGLTTGQLWKDESEGLIYILTEGAIGMYSLIDLSNGSSYILPKEDIDRVSDLQCD